MDAVALRIHFHFHCPKKKVAADSFSRNSFPRVNYLLPSDNPLNNKCIRNRNRDFLCLPLTFASLFAFVCLLIYFGSLLKAAAVILITIYLFISYLRNGIVWSHAPPPHCQLNFLLAAGTQSIPLLFSFARAKFVGGIVAAPPGGIWL